MIVTGYDRGDVERIERMVGVERARWFSARELRRCDDVTERMYGDDGRMHADGMYGDDGRMHDEDDANAGVGFRPVVHWGTSPNRPEDNAPGDPNAYWFSFSPGLPGEGSRTGSSVGVVDGDLAVGVAAVVVVPLAAWCALRRRRR